MNKGILLFLGCLLLVSVSGCGSSSSTTTTTKPNALLFAANTFSPSVSALTVTTGALGPATPFATTGNFPLTLAAVSDKFLYAGLPTSGGVITTVLGRPAVPGASGGILLMPIKANAVLDTPQLFASGDYGVIAVTPSGNALYAADQTNSLLAAFSIDSTKGTLTAIGPQGPPAGLPVGFDPFSIAIDPLGKYVFVANCNCITPHNPPQGAVSVFSIDSSTGALAAVGKFPIGGEINAHPVALAVSPDSKFLFVASLDDQVYVENIALDTGKLTDAAVAQLPLAGSKPVTIAVSTDGNFLYTGNTGTQTISFFLTCTQNPPTITGCGTNSNGNLVHQSDIPVTSPGAFGTLVADPAGGFLYIPDFDHNTVLVFSIASCSGVTVPCTPGSLSQSSAVNTGGAKPFGLAIAPIPTSK
ncbi:MAG TPA: beta-propeller fold lactonase family protein [Terriglobales bacterium]|nr:beta-propeller fold lactonase family protein [Terriglobales bacterium]